MKEPLEEMSKTLELLMDRSPLSAALPRSPRVSLIRVEARSWHRVWSFHEMPVYLRDCVDDRVPTDLLTKTQ